MHKLKYNTSKYNTVNQLYKCIDIYVVSSSRCFTFVSINHNRKLPEDAETFYCLSRRNMILFTRKSKTIIRGNILLNIIKYSGKHNKIHWKVLTLFMFISKLTHFLVFQIFKILQF